MNDLSVPLLESETKLMKVKPFYVTEMGQAYVGDAIKLIEEIPDESIDLIMTSPPYGLRKKKEYNNADPEVYIEWFMPFAREFYRVLKPTGSFVSLSSNGTLKSFI